MASDRALVTITQGDGFLVFHSPDQIIAEKSTKTQDNRPPVLAQIKQEQNKELAQTLAWVMYNGAALMAVAVNDPKRFPRLEEAFLSLFERKDQQDWRLMKARMEDFAKARNG